MSTLSPKVNLWVKSEPFNIGVLPVPPHPRLNVHNIKKIVTYAKSKGKNGFPLLSYSVWKHIACNKLQLTEDVAWTYFVTFDLISDVPVAPRHEVDRRFARCGSLLEIDEVKLRTSVPTLKLVLFLYLQQLQKISLRASLVSGSDEWPMRARSPDLDGRNTPTSGKILDEHSHMTFVLNNLNEIMELFIEPESYSGGSGVDDLSLSVEAVEAIGLIIGGSWDNNRTMQPLKDLAQQIHQSNGSSKVNVETKRSPRGWKMTISRSYSFRSLQSWLRSNIGQNPYGVSSCISQGRRLSWPLAGEDKEKIDSKRGKIATNVLLVPKENMQGNKLIIMSQVCKQTVARSSNTLEGSIIKIHRCHNSFIYLLSPLRSVSIEKCRNSTIVLGAVETTIHMNHCEGTTVIAAARRFSASGSTNCILHMLTPTRPLIYSGNEKITLAPYHTHYPRLEEHMKKVSLSTYPNVWDNPHCIGPDHDDNPVWSLMSTRIFYPFSIPFNMEGATKATPGGLPVKYQKAMAARDQKIKSWQNLVKEKGLDKAQKKQFQALVESRFQEWLIETGHKREIDSLVVPAVPSKFR